MASLGSRPLCYLSKPTNLANHNFFVSSPRGLKSSVSEDHGGMYVGM